MIESYNQAKELGIELIVEITEYTIVEDLEILAKLNRENGIRFAVDDFGSGFSNIKTLIELASKKLLSFVKIDGSLIADIEICSKKRNVLKQLIKFIDIMGLNPIVAEFVDSKEKVEILKSMSDKIVYQGFYFSIPKKIEELGKL